MRNWIAVNAVQQAMKRTKMISSVTLMVGAFLALIAGINAANPKWKPLNATELTFPLLRGSSTSVYTGPPSNRSILFAGFSVDNTLGNPRLNDVWVLTNANGLVGGTSTWSKLSTAGSPPVRSNHSAVYDAAHNRMIIYGGCGAPLRVPPSCQPIANDVWVLSNADGTTGTPTWAQLFPTGGPPPARQAHQAVYDPNTNSMILWAGQTGVLNNNCDTYSDVWVLSNANGLGGTPNWTHLSPTGGPPAGQYQSTAVYDSSNNIMTVFGGVGMLGTTCQTTNAVWALSHANGTGGSPVWSNLVAQGATGSPANRWGHAAVYLPSSNTMTIFGGVTACCRNPLTMDLGDTWVLSNANGIGGPAAWTHLNASGPVPSSRYNNVGIDTVNHLMIMGGGGVSGGIHDGPLWGSWVLSHPDGP
jgi:hypothetical protein